MLPGALNASREFLFHQRDTRPTAQNSCLATRTLSPSSQGRLGVMRIDQLKDSAVVAGAGPVRPRISRGVFFGRAAGGYGFRWTVTTRMAIVFALGLATAPALAGSTHASGEQELKARAVLDFRIVIPETLSIGPRTTRRIGPQPYVSRTTQYRDGRLVVTIARP
jgi:hypothetical protein